MSSWDNYPKATSNSIVVGEFIGEFFADIIKTSGHQLKPANIHIIGHSLGSHAAAHFGRKIIAAGLGKVGRITALDPAKPLMNDQSLIINKEDASFVDVIHTNSGQVWEVSIY